MCGIYREYRSKIILSSPLENFCDYPRIRDMLRLTKNSKSTVGCSLNFVFVRDGRIELPPRVWKTPILPLN